MPTDSESIDKLRHRLTIQTPLGVGQSLETAKDSTGQPLPGWRDESTVWGSYEATGVSEVEAGDQVRSTVVGIVKIRANPSVTAKKRFKANGYGLPDNLILNISGVQPPDSETGFQTVMVSQPPAGLVL